MARGDTFENVLKYDINQADIQAVQKALKDEPLRAKRIIADSLNKQAGTTKNELKISVQSAYTVRTAGVNARVKIQRASPNHLEAWLKIGGRTLTLTRFHTTAPKTGAKAEVIKGSGLQKLVKGGIKAFKQHGFIMQRKKKTRTPLKVLRGPSVPKMMEMIYLGKRGHGPVYEDVVHHLHEDVLARLRK